MSTPGKGFFVPRKKPASAAAAAPPPPKKLRTDTITNISYVDDTVDVVVLEQLLASTSASLFDSMTRARELKLHRMNEFLDAKEYKTELLKEKARGIKGMDKPEEFLCSDIEHAAPTWEEACAIWETSHEVPKNAQDWHRIVIPMDDQNLVIENAAFRIKTLHFVGLQEHEKIKLAPTVLNQLWKTPSSTMVQSGLAKAFFDWLVEAQDDLAEDTLPPHTASHHTASRQQRIHSPSRFEVMAHAILHKTGLLTQTTGPDFPDGRYRAIVTAAVYQLIDIYSDAHDACFRDHAWPKSTDAGRLVTVAVHTATWNTVGIELRLTLRRPRWFYTIGSGQAVSKINGKGSTTQTAIHRIKPWNIDGTLRAGFSDKPSAGPTSLANDTFGQSLRTTNGYQVEFVQPSGAGNQIPQHFQRIRDIKHAVIQTISTLPEGGTRDTSALLDALIASGMLSSLDFDADRKARPFKVWNGRPVLHYGPEVCRELGGKWLPEQRQLAEAVVEYAYQRFFAGESLVVAARQAHAYAYYLKAGIPLVEQELFALVLAARQPCRHTVKGKLHYCIGCKHIIHCNDWALGSRNKCQPCVWLYKDTTQTWYHTWMERLRSEDRATHVDISAQSALPKAWLEAHGLQGDSVEDIWLSGHRVFTSREQARINDGVVLSVDCIAPQIPIAQEDGYIYIKHGLLANCGPTTYLINLPKWTAMPSGVYAIVTALGLACVLSLATHTPQHEEALRQIVRVLVIQLQKAEHLRVPAKQRSNPRASKTNLVEYASKLLTVEELLGEVLTNTESMGTGAWLATMPGYDAEVIRQAREHIPTLQAYATSKTEFRRPAPKSLLSDTDYLKLQKIAQQYAQILERDFRQNLVWYKDARGLLWPSFLSPHEEEKARGSVNADIIYKLVLERWERACFECDYGRDHTLLTVSNIYRQLLLWRLQNGCSDVLLQRPVMFLQVGDFMTGGIGHARQKQPLSTIFSTPNGADRTDEKPELLNMLLRCWRSRQFIVCCKLAGETSTRQFIRELARRALATLTAERWPGAPAATLQLVRDACESALADQSFPVLRECMIAKVGEPGYRKPQATVEEVEEVMATVELELSDLLVL